MNKAERCCQPQALVPTSVRVQIPSLHQLGIKPESRRTAALAQASLPGGEAAALSRLDTMLEKVCSQACVKPVCSQAAV
jgi:hypothetical protein